MFFRNTTEKRTTGRLGETMAAEYLIGQRYEILEKNYRKQYGEIDIVARDRGTLVFVEVKTRHSIAFGTPAEAVDARKQRQLSKTAQEYLQRHQLHEAAARFDVIGVILDRDNRPVKIEHVKNAFELAG